MDDLMEDKAFYYGLICGIKLYQQKIITAHRREESIRIEGESYYIQDEKDKLQDLIDKVCR